MKNPVLVLDEFEDIVIRAESGKQSADLLNYYLKPFSNALRVMNEASVKQLEALADVVNLEAWSHMAWVKDVVESIASAMGSDRSRGDELAHEADRIMGAGAYVEELAQYGERAADLIKRWGESLPEKAPRVSSNGNIVAAGSRAPNGEGKGVLVGMQCNKCGWAAFDSTNKNSALNSAANHWGRRDHGGKRPRQGDKETGKEWRAIHDAISGVYSDHTEHVAQLIGGSIKFGPDRYVGRQDWEAFASKIAEDARLKVIGERDGTSL